MKKTQFKFEDVIDDIIGKESIWPEQFSELNNFLAKMMWILTFVWI